MGNRKETPTSEVEMKDLIRENRKLKEQIAKQDERLAELLVDKDEVLKKKMQQEALKQKVSKLETELLGRKSQRMEKWSLHDDEEQDIATLKKENIALQEYNDKLTGELFGLRLQHERRESDVGRLESALNEKMRSSCAPESSISPRGDDEYSDLKD